MTGGEILHHGQPMLSHTALTSPQRGHHGVKPHESPEPSKQRQAPSDRGRELTTPSQRAAGKSSPQVSIGAVGHPCSASTQGSRTYCTPKQLVDFEKAPWSPQGLFFAKIHWTDMTKHTLERKLKDIIQLFLPRLTHHVGRRPLPPKNGFGTFRLNVQASTQKSN